MPLIKVILGSTRPNRFGAQAAAWVMDLAKEHPEATFELVDVADLNLPLLDEPQPPLFGNYQKEYTKKWSAIVDEADGFVVITPEYNHGVPAALKNAFDFLAVEWRYKPIAFVSYGTELGGGRAVEQFRGIVANFDMYDIRDQVTIANYWGQLDEAGVFTANSGQIEAAHKVLNRVAFWADAHQQPRKQLAEKATDV